MFNDRIQPGAVLYGYSDKNDAGQYSKGLKYFKVISREDNKAELAKLPTTLNEFNFKSPVLEKPKLEQLYTVKINNKITKIKYDGKAFPIKMWDGEPKYDN